MAHKRLRFVMPAPAVAVFEAFHNHAVRSRWDTLVKGAYLDGGGNYPSVGAVTVNRGRDWKRWFTMDTRYVKYDPPRVAAAVMDEPTGVFAQWAASMHHHDLETGGSELIYTFTIRLRPPWLGFFFNGVTGFLYSIEMRRRFRALRKYLRKADEEK